MRIDKVSIKNFRLLEDAEVSLESVTTVIVGRNNSGKTSLTEFFAHILGDEPKRFRLEDFSASTRTKFIAAKALHLAGEDPKKVMEALPVISATITVSYDPGAADLNALAPFIIDLDPTCKVAKLRIDYRASSQLLSKLLDTPTDPAGPSDPVLLFDTLKETIPKSYEYSVVALDPTDATNERSLELKTLTDLFQFGFIAAQRALDHHKRNEPNVLGKLLEALFTTASSATAAATDQAIAADLKAAVASIEKSIHDGFNEKLTSLLPKIASFGYPGLNDPDLRTETALDVTSLLTEHTKVYYTGAHGVHLPEGYNGLGARNLIYILLQLLSFHKAFRAKPQSAGVHLIFIEEPEAHLHPQMQEVFIRQLNATVAEFAKEYPNDEWPVQFLVTTHSSHVANAASFDAIRYFMSKPTGDGLSRRTQIKDFRKGADAIPKGDRAFLHQYMTLTKCDLYFADKAILVEGTTERLLIPRLLQLVDRELDDGVKLTPQYISTVEVDGANAKAFAPLLDYLELKTLVITDLDSVKLDPVKNRHIKCPYSEGTRTLNTTLRYWFSVPDGQELTLDVLRAKKAEEKIQGYRRIAYQIHEKDSDFCARTYEDAFILANPKLFGLAEGEHWGDKAYELAQDMGKVATALRYAIEIPEWNVPAYIKEGLIWLSTPPPAPALQADPATPPAAGSEADTGGSNALTC